MKIILLLLLLTSFSFAEDTLVVIKRNTIPPYIIAEEDRGIELDIARAALSEHGYVINTELVSAKTFRKDFSAPHVNGALTANEASLLEATLSDEYICYENVAISLKGNELKIDSIADLSGKKIVAWQDATVYLGDTYRKTIYTTKMYKEVQDQAKQLDMLFDGECNVIVIDKNIFHYLLKKKSHAAKEELVAVHSIFPKTCYQIAFKNKKHAEQFNTGLKKLKESGEYQNIFDRYLK